MSKKDTKRDDRANVVDEQDEPLEDIDTKNLDEPTREMLQERIAELDDDLKRSQADFINLKRRTAQSQTTQATRIKTDIVREVLPVLDSIERAIEQKPEELADNSWAEGIDAIYKQLRKTLADYGVERIETVEAEFDPNLHEAVSVDESTKGEKEIVIEELQAGYTLGDTVLRHAMVVVGRK